MPDFILHMAGIDFDQTVYDTQNLSIIRGGSLALLYAPRAVKAYLGAQAETIFCAASQGAFKIKANSEKEAKEIAEKARSFLRGGCKGTLPTAHMSFVVDWAEIKKTTRKWMRSLR